MLVGWFPVFLLLLLIHLPLLMPGWRSWAALCLLWLVIGFGMEWALLVMSEEQLPRDWGWARLWRHGLVWVVPVPLLARAMVLAARSAGWSQTRVRGLVVLSWLMLPLAAMLVAAWMDWVAG